MQLAMRSKLQQSFTRPQLQARGVEWKSVVSCQAQHCSGKASVYTTLLFEPDFG